MNVVGNGFVVYAQQYVASGLTAVLIATTPFWSALIERLLPNGERFSTRALGGPGLGFTGIVILVWPEMTNGGAGGRAFIDGVIAIQLACIGWVIGTSYAKRHELGDNPFRSTALQMVFSGIMLLTAATAHGDWAQLSFTPRTIAAMASEHRRLAGRVLRLHLRDPAPAAAAGLAVCVHQSDDRGGAWDAVVERAAVPHRPLLRRIVVALATISLQRWFRLRPASLSRRDANAMRHRPWRDTAPIAAITPE